MKARFTAGNLPELLALIQKYVEPGKEYSLDLCQVRTLDQNAYYRGVVIPIFSEITGYSHKKAHEILSNRFLIENGRKRSTESLTTIEFETYLNDCRMWIYHQFNTAIPMPNQLDNVMFRDLENVYYF